MLDDAAVLDVATRIANASDPRLTMARVLRELATALRASARGGSEGQGERRRLAREMARIAEQLCERDLVPGTLREQLEALREQLIHEAMTRSQNNVTRAARELGVSRNLIYSVVTRSRLP